MDFIIELLLEKVKVLKDNLEDPNNRALIEYNTYGYMADLRKALADLETAKSIKRELDGLLGVMFIDAKTPDSLL